MASLGQKLEEARNRKGISIREAEESTKIRGHYLASFEQDNFDLNLPPVYLGGFVKVYARFLGLDTEAVLAELEAHLPSDSGKAAHKTLGSLSSSEGAAEGMAASGAVAAVNPSGGGSPLSATDPSTPPGTLRPILLVSAGVFVVTVIIVGLVMVLSGPSSPDTPPVDANSSVSERPVAAALGQDEISLHLAAYGPIERLILSDDGAKLPQNKYYDRKDLKAGWEETMVGCWDECELP